MPFFSCASSKRTSSKQPSSHSTRTTTTSHTRPTTHGRNYLDQQNDSSELDVQSREYRLRQHLARGGTREEFRAADARERPSTETRDWQAAQQRRWMRQTVEALEREPPRKGESAAEKRERIMRVADGRE